MTDKYEEAIEWLNKRFKGDTVFEGHPLHTIDRALKIARALEGEPSEGMLDAAIDRKETGVPIYGEVFKAMRDKLIEEVVK